MAAVAVSATHIIIISRKICFELNEKQNLGPLITVCRVDHYVAGSTCPYRYVFVCDFYFQELAVVDLYTECV